MSKQALLIGRDFGLAWMLPQLLARAGFQVDVITSSRIMKHCKNVQDCQVIPPTTPFTFELKKRYDWIIVTDDETIQEILRSDLPLEKKLLWLPVKNPQKHSHLYSKIGLSRILQACGVNTPPFQVACSREQAVEKAQQIGYPIFVKVDSSGGGQGVFECNRVNDLKALPNHLFSSPLLIQKKIFGIELDLSSIYLEEDLIHFNWAQIQKTTSRFGASCLRTYRPMSRSDFSLFSELVQIGKALSVHGFTNLSCIESEGRRFYFEVDARPNGWIEFPRYLGEDPAPLIQNWFTHRHTLSYPVSRLKNSPNQMQIAHFFRIKRWEFLCNRYGIWNYLPQDDPELIKTLIKLRLFSIHPRFLSFLKTILPSYIYETIRKWKKWMIGDRY